MGITINVQKLYKGQLLINTMIQERECIICGEKYFTLSPKQKCCSDECSLINDKDYQLKYQIKYRKTDKYRLSQEKYRKSGKKKIAAAKRMLKLRSK
jgi:predicted nucleic acid-binding Zn ribbon protein